MNTVVLGNMSNQEAMNTFGGLPTDRIEKLIDMEILLGNVTLESYELSEAGAQYPEEDFLENVIEQIMELESLVRGHNRDLAVEIREALEEIQTTTARATEYGLEKLRKIGDAVTELDPC